MRNATPIVVVCLLLLPSCVQLEPKSPEKSSPAATARDSTQPSTTHAAGKAASDYQTAEEQLQGNWLADDVDVSTGEATIKLSFRDDGRMKLAAWSDILFVGQVRDKTAPYEVHGNTISSEAIHGGTSVDFRFEDDKLIITYEDGKSVRFHRA